MTGDEVVAVLPGLRAMAKKLMGNGTDPQDLVQEACVKLLDPGYKVVRWVLKAECAMRDHVRQQGVVRFRRRGKNRAVASYRVHLRPGMKTYEPEQHGIFWDHFTFLSADQLRALRMHVEGGVGKRDVGRRLGLTEMQAHRLIGSGLALIRERWERQGHKQKECA